MSEQFVLPVAQPIDAVTGGASVAIGLLLDRVAKDATMGAARLWDEGRLGF